MKYLSMVCLTLFIAGVTMEVHAKKVKRPTWLSSAQKTHKGFKGNKKYVAQFGDSITNYIGFWEHCLKGNPAQYMKKDGLLVSPHTGKWEDVIEGSSDKGPIFGNERGWKIHQLVKSVDGVLATKQPAMAFIMIGTNDVRQNKVPANYKKDLESIIQKCIKAKCIPVLSTIPPFAKNQQGVAGVNKIVKALAKKYKLYLIDFYAEIIKRHPKDWHGTLIGKDGCHPSGGASWNISDKNIEKDGYALRNYLSFKVFREIYFHVLTAKKH